MITIREMVVDDIYRGFLECLDHLEKTAISPVEAIEVFRARCKSGVKTFVAMVGAVNPWVAGTATLVIEPKYLPGVGLVGHLEDVVVIPTHRGDGVGTRLVRFVLGVCKDAGFCRVVTDCNPVTTPFFLKCGFKALNTDNLRLTPKEVL